MTSPGRESRPTGGEVLGAMGEAAARLGAFTSRLIEERPSVALSAALAAGFIVGGGLASRLGSRLTGAALRAGMTNVGTLAALDLVRRAVEDHLGTASNGTSQ
jgi:hypothetical protein